MARLRTLAVCLQLVKQELTAGLGLSGSGNDGGEARRAGDARPGHSVPSATVGLGTGHHCVWLWGDRGVGLPLTSEMAMAWRSFMPQDLVTSPRSQPGGCAHAQAGGCHPCCLVPAWRSGSTWFPCIMHLWGRGRESHLAESTGQAGTAGRVAPGCVQAVSTQESCLSCWAFASPLCPCPHLWQRQQPVAGSMQLISSSNRGSWCRAGGGTARPGAGCGQHELEHRGADAGSWQPRGKQQGGAQS